MKILKRHNQTSTNTKFVFDHCGSFDISSSKSYDEFSAKTNATEKFNNIKMEISFVIDTKEDIQTQVENALKMVKTNLIEQGKTVSENMEKAKIEEQKRALEYENYQTEQAKNKTIETGNTNKDRWKMFFRKLGKGF